MCPMADATRFCSLSHPDDIPLERAKIEKKTRSLNTGLGHAGESGHVVTDLFHCFRQCFYTFDRWLQYSRLYQSTNYLISNARCRPLDTFKPFVPLACSGSKPRASTTKTGSPHRCVGGASRAAPQAGLENATQSPTLPNLTISGLFKSHALHISDDFFFQGTITDG